ncbi:hypothetical protein [Piscirickettsia litoralis]|uniref:Uncharacterized protein n=1 Tax=Piscirickettsia litoralis TaxID=1891921 RepID=A0ABX3A6S4_9GAMM|nr:hypothetical protein [Piscirickettsia litoralis]ODN43205.1 hypothetical protein BGC07_10090 [Piscirickettsia litoralis]
MDNQMLTEQDEGRGLVKTYWQDVRERVAKVEPTFAKLVDELDPGKEFPLFLAYYPYGSIIGQQEFFFPRVQGPNYSIFSDNTPQDIVKHLGYGIGSAPFGIILGKTIEAFIDFRDKKLTTPYKIFTPGTFAPFARILSTKNKNPRVYSPNGVLAWSAGARSTFMLPKISSVDCHRNLQKDFNISASAPRGLYDHWEIFGAIANSSVTNSDWRCCMLFFSESWIKHIINSTAWFKIKNHLYETAWGYSEYQRNSFYFSTIFSMIQEDNNLKPNPYLVDTIKHLFTSMLGVSASYSRTTSDSLLPYQDIQKAFIESYGLKKYQPCIIQPNHFNFERDTHSVYYSLQYPSTYTFSPKSRTSSTTILEIRELKYLMDIFIDKFKQEDSIVSDTIMHQLTQNVEINYFHNKKDSLGIIQHSSNIKALDKNFYSPYNDEMQFPSDAPFLRGCISINRKPSIRPESC